MPNRLLSAPAPSSFRVLGSSLLVALALVGVPLTALVAGPVGGASAHAELESSDPKDGATLTARPAQVTLTFADRVDAATARSRVTVAGDDGADYRYDPKPTVDGGDVIVPLEQVTEAGAYTVTYRVVSEDGHPVEGSVSFTVTPGPTPEESASGEATTEPAAASATTVAVPGTGAIADDVNPAWLYLAGGLAVLAAGGTAVAMVTRRRTP